MSHKEYIELREKVIDAMWEKNVFPETRADKIMELLGVKHRKIGLFRNQESAAIAYNFMATILFGAFSRINKII